MNWEIAYSTSIAYKAELVKQMLELNNINAIVVNRQDSSYLFGEIEVKVLADNIIEAKMLTEKFDKDYEIE